MCVSVRENCTGLERTGSEGGAPRWFGMQVGCVGWVAEKGRRFQWYQCASYCRRAQVLVRRWQVVRQHPRDPMRKGSREKNSEHTTMTITEWQSQEERSWPLGFRWLAHVETRYNSIAAFLNPQLPPPSSSSEPTVVLDLEI